MLRYDTLTTCIFLYLVLLDVKCHVQEMMLCYDRLTTCIMVVDAMDHVWLAFVFRFNHRENLMKDLAKMADKRRLE